MLSRLLKPPSKESRRKGCKDDASGQLSRTRHDDLVSPRTPRTPRLERARNMRWHLVDLDEIPRLSGSSHSDTSRHDLSSPTLSEPVSLLEAENKADKRVESNDVQSPLPANESTPKTISKSSISTPPQNQEQQVLDDCDDGDRSSSEYTAGSSAGSPPKNAENARVTWEEPALLSAFTTRARRKISTTKRPQLNGLNKVMPASVLPPLQENVEAVRDASPLPFPHPTKAPPKEEALSLITPHPSDVARAVSKTVKTVHNKHNFSGPLRVRYKRDQSPNPLSSNPSTSPCGLDVARSTAQGRKTMVGKISLSGPLQVQGKRDITFLPSPSRSPLQSPVRSPVLSPNVTGARFTPQPAPQDELHIAHPLPLPWPAHHAAPVSPRSNTSSADRSEDSYKVDPPLVPPRWSRCPPEADSVRQGGRWLKGASLGSGSFGKVYRGHHSETGDMCAIKEVEIVSDDPRSKECAKQLAQEIALLSMLRHPNILHYKGSEMVDENLYIYLELVSGGSIYRLLQEFNTFSEPVIRRYTRQILLGLEFLHSRNTVHRDIKCANILVDQDGRVKLADFGMAKLIGKETAPLSFKGSPYWMAPEVILQNNTGYECAVDIWSLGCTVIEMATGKPPWHQYEGYAAMFKVMNSYEVPIPKSLSETGQNFVTLCLQRDPAKRPSATHLLDHPFVQVDRATNYPSQAVNDTLYQGMMHRGMRRDSDCPPVTHSQRASRDSACHFTNGTRSARPSHHGHMPTSRSAIQLSDYSRPMPTRDARRLGRLSDTEDYASWREGPPPVARACLLNRDVSGTQEVQAWGKRLSGLDAHTPGLHSTTN